MRIRVLVADDNTTVREDLCRLLDLEKDIEVVGTASNGLEAKEKAEELRPDVVLMDVKMPIMDGIEAVRQIKMIYPESRIVMLSIYDKPQYLSESLKAGATTYVLKGVSFERLAEVIRDVQENKKLPKKIDS